MKCWPVLPKGWIGCAPFEVPTVSPTEATIKGKASGGAILVRRPDRLRLETLSLVGAIFVLTANGDEIRVLLPRKRVFSRGKSSRANLLRFTRIPLELKELTSLLLGLPPVEVEGPWEGSGSTLVQRFPWGGGQRIEFDPGLGIPFKWDRYDSHGENEITAVFSRFVSTPMGPFPTKISLQYPAQGRSWEIRYQDPEVNVDIPTPFFMLQRPSTFREVPLESFGG